MGNDSEEKIDVYLDGEKVKIEPLPEITQTEPAREEETAFRLTDDMKTEIPLKVPKDYRCGSRKRFIKLLMSVGVERNLAASVAKVARTAGVQYRELWQGYFFWQGEKRGENHEPV